MHFRGFLLLLLLIPCAQAAHGQERTPASPPDSTSLRFGLEQIRPPFRVVFPVTPGVDALWLRPRFTDWVHEWDRTASAKLATTRASLLRVVASVAPSPANPVVRDTTRLRPLQVVAAADTARKGAVSNPFSGVIGDYADVGMQVQGRGELGGAWQRYHPCDPGVQFTCNPSLFPQLKPDMQFGVRVGGTISNRVHVNVDYDQRREFDAANNINVYYQGMEDEVLQRLEVGDVSIRLPPSRYLTQGIPAGNFGFKATGQLGPIDFQTVFAQQRGDLSQRQFRLGGAVGANSNTALVQDARLTIDDGQYVQGQFFFDVDPSKIVNAPHINILTLRSTDAPSTVRPSQGVAIQVFRDERPSIQNQQQQAQLGYFLSDATTADGKLKHSGLFRRLTPGDDYQVHSSGLWLMLRAPLRPDEAVAVAYVTESGDSIGKLNPERVPTGTTPVLRLIRGPSAIHQPGTATWDYELHDVYRVDSSNGVDPASVALTISLGEQSGGKTFTDYNGQRLTLLKLFGLDEDPPAEQIDAAQVFQPAKANIGNPQQAAKINGTYIILPTLRPFLAPPPLRSVSLTAEQTKQALGTDANDAIYNNPDPVVRESSGRFRLNFAYRVKVDGLVSQFNLGALGIRDASEKITVGGVQLARGKDYTIDYDVGAVTLTNAAALFGANPDAEIRATWEQKAQFQIAPTSVFGMNARYLLGKRGELNFMGLYQGEKTLMSRPTLGVEPAAIFLGGASGRVDLGGALLDRALSHLPGLRFNGFSAINLTGEMALSLPNPNTRGFTYVDDFESTDDVPLSLDRTSWKLGSKPDRPDGAEAALPLPLGVSTAMRLVWQDQFLNDMNQTVGPLNAHDQIDSQITVAGTPLPETVLWLAAGDSASNGVDRKWRSLTTVLSTTGRDMTRTEFLEFYVGGNLKNGSLIFDIGSVGEDAFHFDSNGRTNGTYPDGKQWGLGILDQEADIAKREIWSTALDSLGLWNEECRGSRELRFRLGDPRADCTRGNGLVDTEDLSGDGVPELQDGAYFRYVVTLDNLSPYLVRDGQGTGTSFRLYRIPLRKSGVFSRVGGATDGTWRFIKHLRMTLAGSPLGVDTVVFARMRLIGSRWSKRDSVGVLRGVTSDLPGISGAAANFQAGPASRLTDGTAYVSPPGVGDQLLDPTSVFGTVSVEFNEKSLRLAFDQLAGGDRAEVYYRYPQQPRSFLNYRALRLWAVARTGRFGPQGDQRLLIKVGNDPRNYYLYQTRLHAAPANGIVTQADWLPEIVIDFEQWFNLKAQAEQRLITSAPPSGGPMVLWSADSSYAIVLEDRAREPNLGAVRELSFAVYNGGLGFQKGEVWIDDMRLGAAMTDPGFAGNLNVDVRAGDFISANASYASQGALFHQLKQDASYLRAGDFGVNATAQLGNLLPAGWGIEMPLTVSHARNLLDPTFLPSTDVLASELPGLRASGGVHTRVGMTVRKRTPTANPWLGLLFDGLALRVGYNGNRTENVTALDQAGGVDGGLSYTRNLGMRAFDPMPGFIKSALRAIFPQKIENSDFFRRLTTARLRWTPENISLNTGYYNQYSRSYRYDRILRLDSDSLVRPIMAPRLGLTNDARVSFHPFQSLIGDISWNNARDLLPPERSALQKYQRAAIAAARSTMGGVNIGWETDRSLGAQMNWRPEIATWLRPSFGFTNRFRTDRNLAYLQLIAQGADTTALLQRAFQGDRQVTRALQIDPGGFALATFGARTAKTGTAERSFSWVLTAIRPVDLSWNSGLNSQFERAEINPGLGYQLGLGGLSAFQQVGGDTAVSSGQRNQYRARSGLVLPFKTLVDFGIDRSTGQIYSLAGGARNQAQRTWPDVRVTWAELPIPDLISRFVPRASITTGYTQTYHYDIFGSGDVIGQKRSGTERSVPVGVQLGLGKILSTSYALALSRGTSTDPTGDAKQDAATHTLSLTGSFTPPSVVRKKFKQPLTATLSVNQQAQRQCRVSPTLDQTTTCTPFIDFVNRTLNLSLDTMLDQLQVGVQMSYTARQSAIGTLNGSSQFQMGVFGQFNFSAGQIPGVPIR
jgi:hypothetical protein